MEYGFRLKNHIVLCVRNHQVKSAIKDYRAARHNVSFVLIDDSLESNPIEEYDVHFIRGNFAEDETLTKANVHHAKTVLIFGDRRIDVNTADAKAMKAVLAIKYLNPEVYTIVECLSGDVRSLKRVGADEVINTSEINIRLLIQTTLSQGISNVIQELLAQESGNDFYEVASPNKYAGKTFKEVAAELLNLGVILIALGGQDPQINPHPETKVEKGGSLIYISKKQIIIG